MDMLTNEDIRAIRKTLRMTAAEFAVAVTALSSKRVSGNTVARWEIGERHPNYANMLALNVLRDKAEKLKEFLKSEGLYLDEGQIGQLQPA